MRQQPAQGVRQILFATDFSAASETAARVALEYTRQFGACLHLLHVVWGGTDPATPPVLAKMAEELQKEVPVVAAVESGSPASQIVRYAEHHGIDLIVLGTHGRTGITRALLGSVAERVVRTAPCPVLTVGREPRAVPPAEEREAPGPLRRCLVCTASSEDLICEPCRARIRGEALERKLRDERAGKVSLRGSPSA